MNIEVIGAHIAMTILVLLSLPYSGTNPNIALGKLRWMLKANGFPSYDLQILCSPHRLCYFTRGYIVGMCLPVCHMGLSQEYSMIYSAVIHMHGKANETPYHFSMNRRVWNGCGPDLHRRSLYDSDVPSITVQAMYKNSLYKKMKGWFFFCRIYVLWNIYAN